MQCMCLRCRIAGDANRRALGPDKPYCRWLRGRLEHRLRRLPTRAALAGTGERRWQLGIGRIRLDRDLGFQVRLAESVQKTGLLGHI